ncbi:MAG: type II toxin-antitoxin system HicA family toxin [Patescibacteria group bacterium]|mgnify:CR=1 FL=1
MPKLKVLSCKDIIKVLESFDFEVISQKGSHVKLRRVIKRIKQTLTIPDHKELDKGTIRAIFNQASKYISPEKLKEFFY